MERPEYFVVRIYRRDAENPEKIEGIVEIVALNTEVPFSDARALQAILQAPSQGRNQSRTS